MSEVKNTVAKTAQGASRIQGLMSPAEIKKHLDKYVIGQEDAKKTLSVAVYNHYKRLLHNLGGRAAVEIDKSNVILLGETGCGKTLLVKTIARLLDVPCYIQDCTKITESGYVGSDVEDCLVGLLRESNYNLEKAQMGIVMLDEADKLAKVEAGPSITRDVGGVGVQQSLLKIVEGDKVGVPPAGGRKHPEQPLIYVDTTNILFVMSGAFVGLDDIVSRRLGTGRGRIGYDVAPADGSSLTPLQYVIPQDLREFGMIPEFIGRFPVVTYVNPLGKNDLVTILTKPKNALVKQYAELLKYDDVKLDFTKGALEDIAELSMGLGTGARGLRTIMETVMTDAMFEAAGGAWSGKTFTVDSKAVRRYTEKKFGKVGETAA